MPWCYHPQGFYQLMTVNGQVRENYQMKRIFNNPSLLYRDGAIDEVTYGMLAAKSEVFDPIFVDDVCDGDAHFSAPRHDAYFAYIEPHSVECSKAASLQCILSFANSLINN